MALTSRTGFSLLEVVVSLAILGTVGVALLATLSASQRAVLHAFDREAERQDAERVLEAVASLPDSVLRSMVGRRPVGRYVVAVSTLEHNVLRVDISTSRTAAHLSTHVYRPAEPPDAR